MKRIITLTLFLSFVLCSAKAQVADGRIGIKELNISENNGTVTVSFTADIDRKAAKRNQTLVFAPVITHGEYRQSLPAIVVQGKGRTAKLRREWVAGKQAEYPGSIYAVNGEKVKFSSTVPAQRWMHRAGIRFESVEGGCCTYRNLDHVLLAQNILPDLIPEKPQPVAEPEPEPVRPTASTADSLSTAFNFVVPDSEYDEAEPFKIYDDERENSLIVYYNVGKHVIEKNYLDNQQTLDNLTAAINMILSSADSKVKRIIVAGFASPEGSFEANDRLAFERAVSVKEYIMETTGMEDNKIMIYNGSVDWRGLRAMIAKSNLPEKRQLLDIIDYTPVWGTRKQAGRLAELMKLNDGRTYRYLLHEYFPYLRNGAFIKVYYENQ